MFWVKCVINADGSEASMCGNGQEQFRGIVKNTTNQFKVETLTRSAVSRQMTWRLK